MYLGADLLTFFRDGASYEGMEESLLVEEPFIQQEPLRFLLNVVGLFQDLL